MCGPGAACAVLTQRVRARQAAGERKVKGIKLDPTRVEKAQIRKIMAETDREVPHPRLPRSCSLGPVSPWQRRCRECDGVRCDICGVSRLPARWMPKSLCSAGRLKSAWSLPPHTPQPMLSAISLPCPLSRCLVFLRGLSGGVGWVQNDAKRKMRALKDTAASRAQDHEARVRDLLTKHGVDHEKMSEHERVAGAALRP